MQATTFIPFSLNLGGKLVEIDRPWVMGILNVTPDSFYDGGSHADATALEEHAARMAHEGADVIDVGGYSTRPGAGDVPADEELRRVEAGVKAVRRAAPDMIISVDTFRAHVARRAIEEMGAHIINDISFGTLDKDMFATIRQLNVPYILTHSRGTPATMQTLTHYDNGVTATVLEEMARKIDTLRQDGVNDIIADPGFGFAKTVDDNYRLLANLDAFHTLGVPLLVGVSRKSMITRVAQCTPAEALAGTTALHAAALLKGAHILRVHDVAAAVQARVVISKLSSASIINT